MRKLTLVLNFIAISGFLITLYAVIEFWSVAEYDIIQFRIVETLCVILFVISLFTLNELRIEIKAIVQRKKTSKSKNKTPKCD